MIKVLMLGGSGYIGSMMATYMTNYHDVTVLDNLVEKQWALAHLCHKKNFSFIRGDVRNKELMAKLIPQFDVVIDLAAYVGETVCRINPWDAWEVNTKIIKDNIIPNLAKSQLLLFPMTNSGYGTTDGTFYCDENTPLNPISTYGRTKVEAEKIVLDFPNSKVFRLATVYGMSPKMRWELLVNSYVYEAIRNKYLIVFEKNFKRNFIHIIDVAKCFDYAINNHSRMRYSVYNLGNDADNMSKEELANLVKEQVPGTYIHFNDISTDPDKRNYMVSNKRIMEDGFTPTTCIKDGVRELVQGYNLLTGGRFLDV